MNAAGVDHYKRRKRYCSNGHLLESTNVRYTREKRWSKRRSAFVIYECRQCRRCWRVVKKFAARKNRLKNKAIDKVK